MKRYLYVFFTALLLLYGCANESKNNGDTLQAPNLKDDFYSSVNYSRLSSWVIPADKSNISNFSIINDVNYNNLNNLIQQAVLSNSAKGTDEYNIKAFYETAFDWEKRNVSGFGELSSYISAIDEATDIKRLLNISMELDRKYGIWSIYNIAVDSDLEDSNKYVYYLVVNFGISKENWLSENTLFSSSYIEFLKNLWILNGVQSQDAEQIVDEVTNMMKEIAKVSLSINESIDPSIINNRYKLSNIPAVLNNSIDINDLAVYEGSADDTVIITNINAVNKMASYLTDNNLQLIKNYIKTLIYQALSSSVDSETFNAYAAYDAQVSGYTEIKDMEKSVNEQVQQEMAYELGKMYVQKYFNNETKTNITNMINDILNIYRQRINNLSWLSAETKVKAIEKLDKIKVVVGYDENGIWPQDIYNYSYTGKEEGGIFVNNVLSKAASERNYIFTHKNEAVNKDILIESPQTVNAYYSPVQNSITILAGILQDPIYSADTDDAAKAGGIGTIIAHEITHAFDNSGSQYDADGNFGVSWWQESDMQKFNELAQKIVEYYNTYEILGYNINGALTLSENIADLGAVSCITEYALDKGYDLSEVYKSYAELWATKKTEAGEIYAILNDVHSPAKIRVNAVLSATDEFYTVFDIQQTDGMYKAPSERPKIW